MISADDFKAHANINFDTDDTLIEAKILAASEYVSTFLDPEVMARFSDTPAPVKEAVRQLVSHFYEDREGEDGTPESVLQLIEPYRKWVF
ncbi:head-tail connector protein [Terrihabitans rhizophilus]|uniref:Head-tail connector protein n=1 Tax=Terrihabitans rhizophilus TaxID=3092662 RepID=A0ABU4RNN9_9HYPH|nr:head-tail connector protein [Terrihabitans sp. PJ23]MDX6806429.1 head-tail connector protein [Terrihabitans sp. PJ23]